MSYLKLLLLPLALFTQICKAAEPEPSKEEAEFYEEVYYEVCEHPAIYPETDLDEDEYALYDHSAYEGGGGYVTKGVCVAAGFIMGCFMDREKELVDKFLKERREAGAEALKRKPEYAKTLKDHVYEIYDKTLFDGALVSLIKWVEKLSKDDTVNHEKAEMIAKSLANHEKEVKDITVLQITERLLRQESIKKGSISTSSSSSSSSSMPVIPKRVLPKPVYHPPTREVAVGTTNPRLNAIEFNDDSCIVS